MTKFLYLFCALFIVSVISSCASHTDKISKTHTPPGHLTSLHSSSDAKAPLLDKRKIIVQHTLSSLGQRYQWGGHSLETGFDCSGLIFYTHKKAKISTPRTANALYSNGKIVQKHKLTPADLVFFINPKSGKALHVGIYVGDGMFVHAPGRGRQVTYAQLDNPYFKRYYLGSRSFL